MANIQVVDSIVKRTEALFRDFYKDDETAFVFTADHGMSRIGNHGDGGKVRIALVPASNPSTELHPQTRTIRGHRSSRGAKASADRSPTPIRPRTMSTQSRGD